MLGLFLYLHVHFGPLPRKRSGQVLGEEAARRCCGKVLLKGIIAKSIVVYGENTTGKRGEEKGKTQESSYSCMVCFEG